MRLYNQPHRFYATIDLHARSMFAHVLDHAGKTVFEHLPARPDVFLEAIAPFRHGLIARCECNDSHILPLFQLRIHALSCGP